MSYDTLRAKIEQLIEKAQLGGEGESIQYTDVICNDDDTVTLIDTNGIEHTITCVYENNRLTSMTYDGKEVVTVYDFGKLVAVGETEVDVSNTPLDNTLETLIDKSGVLDSTDGTATEKVEQLVKRVNGSNQLTAISCQDNQKITQFEYDCKGIVSLNYAFYNCNKLTTIILSNTETVQGFNRIFAGGITITSIETLDMSNADKDHIGNSNYLWINAPSLKNLKIVPQTIKRSITFVWCSLLSAESIQSIIDGLATVTTAQTLTLHADVKAKLTEDQLATITSKNWSLA